MIKNKHQLSSNTSGFTLIELLVVVAIIGLLASVILASLNNARMKARDTQRKTTLYQLRNASELLYGATGSYAPSAGWLVNWTPNSNPLAPTYIPTISGDPGNNGITGYQYWRKDFAVYPCMTLGAADKYGFYAKLENPSASDLATISDSFDQCVQATWGLNYKVGN